VKDVVPPLFPLDCPMLDRTIEGFTAVGDDALSWWRRLRALHPTTGYWPLLLEPRLWEGSFGEFSKYQSPADSLAQAARLDVRPVLADSRDWDGRRAGDGAEVLAVEAARAWPSDPWTYRIQITHDLSGAPAEVTVALVPVQQPWQIPAVLNYGGVERADASGRQRGGPAALAPALRCGPARARLPQHRDVRRPAAAHLRRCLRQRPRHPTHAAQQAGSPA
jgi:hypothetical protein